MLFRRRYRAAHSPLTATTAHGNSLSFGPHPARNGRHVIWVDMLPARCSRLQARGLPVPHAHRQAGQGGRAPACGQALYSTRAPYKACRVDLYPVLLGVNAMQLRPNGTKYAPSRTTTCQRTASSEYGNRPRHNDTPVVQLEQYTCPGHSTAANHSAGRTMAGIVQSPGSVCIPFPPAVRTLRPGVIPSPKRTCSRTWATTPYKYLCVLAHF